jgi:hypothetical protein
MKCIDCKESYGVFYDYDYADTNPQLEREELTLDQAALVVYCHKQKSVKDYGYFGLEDCQCPYDD